MFLISAVSEYFIITLIVHSKFKFVPLGKKESITKTMKNENDMTKMRLRKSQNQQYSSNSKNWPAFGNAMSSVTEVTKLEDYKKQRTLYVISNAMVKVEEKPLISKEFSSKNSDINEDVELLLKEMMNKKEIEENKYFSAKNLDQYESLSNLRIKRMRESLESPVFGTYEETYKKQRNYIRQFTNNSNQDELDQANTRKNYGSIFQKQHRHFSFAESENSSFPSSYTKNSILRQESLNSKGTVNSLTSPYFNVVSKKDKDPTFNSNKSPSRFKNHLRAIAKLVGADQNTLVIPKNGSFNAGNTKSDPQAYMRKRNTMQIPQLPVDLEVVSESNTSESESTSRNSNSNPPSIKKVMSDPKFMNDQPRPDTGSHETVDFQINVITDEHKASSSSNLKASSGLMPPPKKEVRRLSENPRNINLLHDVPRENNRVRRRSKRKQSSKRRSSGSTYAMLSNMIMQNKQFNQ